MDNIGNNRREKSILNNNLMYPRSRTFPKNDFFSKSMSVFPLATQSVDAGLFIYVHTSSVRGSDLILNKIQFIKTISNIYM